MRWEEMTGPELEGYIAHGDPLALIPVGSLERHADHLPLGTDALVIHEIALRASGIEPCVVMPPLYYAYAPEMKGFPGTVSLRMDVFLNLLENICDEVSRNGFGKILILNGHGGNNDLLRSFLSHSLERGKKYSLYAVISPWAPAKEAIKEIKETNEIGHACEIETSYALYLFPQLCRMNETDDSETRSTGGFEDELVLTPDDWLLKYPRGYVGFARKASPQKGRRLVEVHVARLVKAIRRVKAHSR